MNPANYMPTRRADHTTWLLGTNNFEEDKMSKDDSRFLLEKSAPNKKGYVCNCRDTGWWCPRVDRHMFDWHQKCARRCPAAGLQHAACAIRTLLTSASPLAITVSVDSASYKLPSSRLYLHPYTAVTNRFYRCSPISGLATCKRIHYARFAKVRACFIRSPCLEYECRTVEPEPCRQEFLMDHIVITKPSCP